jgi:hypothetical protein
LRSGVRYPTSDVGVDRRLLRRCAYLWRIRSINTVGNTSPGFFMMDGALDGLEN